MTNIQILKIMFNSHIAVICQIWWLSADAVYSGDADVFTPLHWTQLNLYSLKLFSWNMNSPHTMFGC